jgi:hypothetical protein
MRFATITPSPHNLKGKGLLRKNLLAGRKKTVREESLSSI